MPDQLRPQRAVAHTAKTFRLVLFGSLSAALVAGGVIRWFGSDDAEATVSEARRGACIHPVPRQSENASVDAPVASATKGRSVGEPADGVAADDVAADDVAAADEAASGAVAVTLPQAQVPATSAALEQEARAVAEDLRQRYPDSAQTLHVLALVHAQLRETEKAQNLGQRASEQDPEKDQYRVNLATVAMGRGDYDLAATETSTVCR